MALTVYLVSVFLAPVPLPAQRSGERASGTAPGNDIVAPWVVVFVPETAEGDPRTETVALVVADTIEMTLRLIGDYAVQPRPEGIAAPSATEVATYAERERMDYIVFGEVSADAESETRFSLSVYSREADAVTLEREAVARSLFDTFSVADELSAELLGAFTGQRIAYGRVELRNEADLPGTYRVYIDGSPAGESVTMLDRVLVGEREVAVEALQGLQAGTIVTRQQLTVTEGGLARIAFVAEGVPEPESPPPAAVEEPPASAVLPQDTAPERQVIRIPNEPEIPMEWRVYPWRRWEREGDLVFSGSALFGIEQRDTSTKSGAFLSRVQVRADWGRRSVGVLALEGAFWPRGGEENLAPDPAELEANPLSYDTMLDTYRASAAYGLRLTPLRRVSVTPLVRLGFEREQRIITSVDSDGNEDLGDSETRLLFYEADPQGASTWNIVPGVDVIIETHIRRVALQALIGVHAVLPTESTLSDVYEYEYRDPDTNESTFVRAPVSSELGATWGWYYGIGGGYSWGGSEARVNERRSRERSYDIFPPNHRSAWRAALHITVALPYRIGPDYENQALQLPLLETGIGGALQLSHRSGWLVAPFAYAGPPRGRTSTVLYRSPRDNSIKSTVVATEPSPVLLGAGLGRRLPLTDSLFLTAEYRVAHAPPGKSVRTGSGDSHPRDSAGSEGSALWMGPRLLLEHAIIGTGAVVYGGVWSFAPTPLGVTRYSLGVEDRETGYLMTTDGFADTTPYVVVETGVVIRLFGAPNRFYADTDNGLSWFRYGGGASETRWWIPRFSIGTGVEYVTTSGRGGNRTGFMAVLPVAVRFPFGLEVGAQSSFPLGEGGVSGPLVPLEVVDGTSQELGSEVLAEARINRVVALDLGYRFRRDRRLSWLAGIRYADMDDELWNIQNVFEDGSIMAADDSRFVRAGSVGLAGPIVEVSLAVSERLVLRANGCALGVTSFDEEEVTPALAPTVRHRLVIGYSSVGLNLTMEL